MKIPFTVIFVFACYSCTSNRLEIDDNYDLVISHFVMSNANYYPVNNFAFLENIFLKKANNECSLNIDSLKKRWAVPNNYGSSDISEEKIKSIYREAIESCSNDSDFNLYCGQEENISIWGLDLFRKYYSNTPCEVSKYAFERKKIKGLPYNFVHVQSIEEKLSQDSNQNKCVKYIKVSPLLTCQKYHLIELSYGCGQAGKQKQLYILTKHYGKWTIDNVFNTNYKF
jgi:hypothetical protein